MTTRPPRRTDSTGPAISELPRPWLTVAEVCAELQVPRSTWEKWRQRDVAPKAIRLPNGQLRIRRAWLDEWISERSLMAV